MSTPPDYLDKNRQAWNAKTAHHLASAFYDMPGFLAGHTSLKEIELGLLGDVGGKTILHLQCHFGQDTLSLARMGAVAVGVDLSDAAIEEGRKLNAQLGLSAEFICCDLYSLPAHLDRQFDIVFTSYGTIGWLPDITAWAGIVARYVKPGGLFVFADFHPVMWMFDNDFSRITYRYFNGEPIIETEQGTYADTAAPIATETIGWNHGLAEVIGALLGQGLVLERFKEHDYSPYNCFAGMEEVGPDKFRISSLGDKIPMVYALQMHKPA